MAHGAAAGGDMEMEHFTKEPLKLRWVLAPEAKIRSCQDGLGIGAELWIGTAGFGTAAEVAELRAAAYSPNYVVDKVYKRSGSRPRCSS